MYWNSFNFENNHWTTDFYANLYFRGYDQKDDFGRKIL